MIILDRNSPLECNAQEISLFVTGHRGRAHGGHHSLSGCEDIPEGGVRKHVQEEVLRDGGAVLIEGGHLRPLRRRR
jgi:hypothetical protein